LQTRRSGRVTKRKKYVDDLDLQLSDENRSGDDDSVVVDANDYVNGIPMDQPQTDIYLVINCYFSIHLLVIQLAMFNVEQLHFLQCLVTQ